MNRHARGHRLDHIISVDCTGMAMAGRALILNHTAKIVDDDDELMLNVLRCHLTY